MTSCSSPTASLKSSLPLVVPSVYLHLRHWGWRIVRKMSQGGIVSFCFFISFFPLVQRERECEREMFIFIKMCTHVFCSQNNIDYKLMIDLKQLQRVWRTATRKRFIILSQLLIGNQLCDFLHQLVHSLFEICQFLGFRLHHSLLAMMQWRDVVSECGPRPSHVMR